MDRIQSLRTVKHREQPWDVLVIGGGATGLGVAVDAASRGFSTLLLEQYDFAKGTSSRSTKLVHGGVRYLQQGDVSLVLEALKERGLMLKNAPHLVRNLSFVIPSYAWWNGPFYTVGLKVYDWMAGKLGLGPSKSISREATIEALPTITQEDLRGGVVYHDGQFDDARMAISLALTAADHNATLVNYMKVTELLKDEEAGMVNGVMAIDQETQEAYRIPAKSVVNATGVFADGIKQLDEPGSRRMIKPSQGVHLVLDKSFLPEDYAIMVPQTSDGRVMFAVPWYNKVILGTTDTQVEEPSLEPTPIDQEINFILETAGEYLVKKPSRNDVLSLFAGLRPLAAPEEGAAKATKEISRHHKVLVSLSGLITVVGGKWTTYRKMAEDTVDHAIMIAGLAERKCITKDLQIHGFDLEAVAWENPMTVYGIDRPKVERLAGEDPAFAGYLSESLGIMRAQVIWSVREEMARTLEDVLARRTRALFLDARESIRMSKEVAELMAHELGKDEAWKEQQLKEYRALAQQYYIQDE